MEAPLRLGVIGLGRAFTLMLPTFVRHPRVRLVAAFDPRSDAVARFSNEFGCPGYDTAEGVCTDPNVQAVYVASPHEYHVAHTTLALSRGKHVLVEKPMALASADCRKMIAAARQSGMKLLVGHSHSYDLPYLRTRELIRSGAVGAVKMINSWNYTDFLYRPRRPEELDTQAGGGVVFSQAAHQIDIVRMLAGAELRTVRAYTGNWDPRRNTEGAYCAQLSFENGVFASLTYSGYAHFDTDEFNGWRGELGQKRDPERYGAARAALDKVVSPAEETAMKHRRAYGPTGREAFEPDADMSHNHFGLVIASCERADLRPMPHGIVVHADDRRYTVGIPAPDVPRAEVVDELYEAAILGRDTLHSGEWGLATLQACMAILQSARTGREIALSDLD